MSEDTQTVLNKYSPTGISKCWSSNLDGTLLPTDDQLDQLVDSLCDSFTPFQTSSDSQESPENVSVDNSFGEEPVYSAGMFGNGYNLPENQCDLANETNFQSYAKKVDLIGIENLKQKTPVDKRASANSNLNLMIMQCTRSLEHLVMKRKSLEMLLQVHHNVKGINYTFTYSPRLPDAPSKVDRLMHDISQERCRVLGLVSNMEKTINSFISSTTKEEIRQLLSGYGTAIVDVIKERQFEISYNCAGPNYEAGVQKLIKLLQVVHRFTRRMDTALWCIEVKEQVNLVKSQKTISNLANKSADVKSIGGPSGSVRKNWRENRVFQEQNGRGLKPTAVCTKSNVPNAIRNQNMKTRQYPVYSGIMQQHTNIYQVLPSSPRPRRTATVQLIAQQQRAEIFQRYSSSLKNN